MDFRFLPKNNDFLRSDSEYARKTPPMQTLQQRIADGPGYGAGTGSDLGKVVSLRKEETARGTTSVT